MAVITAEERDLYHSLFIESLVKIDHGFMTYYESTIPYFKPELNSLISSFQVAFDWDSLDIQPFNFNNFTSLAACYSYLSSDDPSSFINSLESANFAYFSWTDTKKWVIATTQYSNSLNCSCQTVSFALLQKAFG